MFRKEALLVLFFKIHTWSYEKQMDIMGFVRDRRTRPITVLLLFIIQLNIWTDQGFVQDRAVGGDSVLALLHHGHLAAVIRAVCQAVD